MVAHVVLGYVKGRHQYDSVEIHLKKPALILIDRAQKTGDILRWNDNGLLDSTWSVEVLDDPTGELSGLSSAWVWGPTLDLDGDIVESESTVMPWREYVKIL